MRGKKQRPKVLYILDRFPVISQTFILNELLAVRKKGVDVTIVSLRQGHWEHAHPSASGLREQILYIKNVSFLKKLLMVLPFLLSNMKLAIRVWKQIYVDQQWRKAACVYLIDCCYLMIVYKNKIHHIHAHFAKEAADYAWYIHLLSDIPYTFTSHGYDIFDDPSNNMREKSQNAYKHITISDFNRTHLMNVFGVPEEKIKVCYLGVDLQKFSFQPELNKDNVILTVGRLEKVKGHVHLIEACRELKSEGLDFQCWIAGEGNKREELSDLISRYGLKDCVLLLGVKTNKEVMELYKKAKIFVLPSLREGLPVVLMEALACGVPAVASRVNGIPEIIEHGKSGLLTEPGNAADITEKMKRLLTDNGLRRACVKGGLSIVKDRFDLDKAADHLIDIWQNATHSKPDCIKRMSLRTRGLAKVLRGA